MGKWIKIGLAAALAVAVSWSGPVWAAGKITVGVAVSQTGRYSEPAGRFVNSWKMYVEEQNATRALEISNRGYVLELGRNRFEGTGQELLGNQDVRKMYLGG